MYLTDKISVQRKIKTDLGSGSFSETFNLYLPNISASIQPSKISESVIGGRTISAEAFDIYTSFEDGIDILQTDRIAYMSNGTETEFEIKRKETYPQVYCKFYCEKIID